MVTMKGYKTLTIRVRATQNEEMDQLMKKVDKDYGLYLNKTNLIRMAISELLENGNLDELLEKYKLI
jgi:hypothetical protein